MSKVNNSQTAHEIGDKFDIFCQNEIKKSGLPLVSSILSSSKDTNLGRSSLPNKSYKKWEPPSIEKYIQNKDIFTNNTIYSNVNNKTQYDNGNFSTSERYCNKRSEYSLSKMFSDGLSDTENSGLSFTYVSSSDDSESDLQRSFLNEYNKKAGKKKCDKKMRLEKNIATNPLKSSNPKSIDSHCTTFRRNEPLDEIITHRRRDESRETEKKLNFSCLKPRNKSSSTFVSFDRKDSGIQSLIDNSMIENENKDRSISDEFHTGNAISGLNCNPELSKSESHSINIALSECNLDHGTNSEDLIPRSIEINDKKMDWHEKFDLSVNELYFESNDSAIRSGEVGIHLQNSFQLSNNFTELFDIGSQVSRQSDNSMVSSLPDFNFSQHSDISFENEYSDNLESRTSVFDISQSMYIKQRSPFFRQKNCREKTPLHFQLCNSISQDIKQFNSEINLPLAENWRQILSPPKNCTSFKGFGKEFVNSNRKKRTTSFLTNNSCKRRYPFNENFSTREMNDNLTICDRDGSIIGDALSDNQRSLNDIIIPHENKMKCSAQRSFWGVSHDVQSFVRESLNREKQINRKISKNCLDEKINEVLPKRRRLDSEYEENKLGIDIDPEILLSNYSSEHDRMIERFKPK